MVKTYFPKGVCSRKYEIELENGIVKNIAIQGGCDGNLKGIAALVKNRKAEELIPIMKGVTCGMKRTSCPDQIALALEEALREEQGA